MKFLKNKNILVTGGTGSFGKKFIDKILNTSGAKKIIVYSRDEQKQFHLQQKYKSKNLRFFIGDIRDKPRLDFATREVDIIIHAAALKHVEISEYNPFEFVKTNILGSQNVIDCAIENKVKKVLALSTDKASSPLNLYGATKLTADKLFIAANNFKGGRDIRFSVVRYGNVLGSRGSVVPLFLKQKKLGLDLTLTNKNMTRFNITLDDAVGYVLNSLKVMMGGEIFVPKLKSYKILDMAKAISANTKIKIIGTRSGEKLHEEMISVADSINTIETSNSYIILPNSRYSTSKKIFEKKYSKSKRVEKNFSYNSLNNKFLSNIELKKIIKNNCKDFEDLK